MKDKPMFELTGPLKAVHQYVDMPTEEVDYTMPNGEVIKAKGCKAAMGHTFSSGTIDGPGIFTFEAESKFSTNPLWNLVKNVIPRPSEEQVKCHANKSILISTGEVGTYDYTVLDISLVVQLSFRLVSENSVHPVGHCWPVHHSLRSRRVYHYVRQTFAESHK